MWRKIDQMLFSVIIPVYNVEKYIKKCLDSVLNQTFKDFEVIAVNDGSTDGCSIILERYNGSIKLINQENRGLGGARNAGLTIARGDYIFFLDSDDYLQECALQKVADMIRKNDSDVVVFPFLKVDENGNVLSSDATVSIEDARDLFLVSPAACNKVFRREIWSTSSVLFPERLYYEDAATIYKLYPYVKKVGYLKQPIYCYLQREGSIIHTQNISRNNDIIKALKGVKDYYIENALQDIYSKEIEYVYIKCLYDALVRLSIASPFTNKTQKKISKFLEIEYPNYSSNLYYIEVFSSKEKKKMQHLMKNNNFVYWYRHQLKVLIQGKGIRK